MISNAKCATKLTTKPVVKQTVVGPMVKVFQVWSTDGRDDLGQLKLDELKATRTSIDVAKDDVAQLNSITGTKHIWREWFVKAA